MYIGLIVLFSFKPENRVRKCPAFCGGISRSLLHGKTSPIINNTPYSVLFFCQKSVGIINYLENTTLHAQDRLIKVGGKSRPSDFFLSWNKLVEVKLLVQVLDTYNGIVLLREVVTIYTPRKCSRPF